jgi:hypothetical protein
MFSFDADRVGDSSTGTISGVGAEGTAAGSAVGELLAAAVGEDFLAAIFAWLNWAWLSPFGWLTVAGGMLSWDAGAPASFAAASDICDAHRAANVPEGCAAAPGYVVNIESALTVLLPATDPATEVIAERCSQ